VHCAAAPQLCVAVCAFGGIETPLSDQLAELLQLVVHTRSSMLAIPAPDSAGPVQVTVRSPLAGIVVAVTFVTAYGASHKGTVHALCPNAFTDRRR
jgi:hypothetical protein